MNERDCEARRNIINDKINSWLVVFVSVVVASTGACLGYAYSVSRETSSVGKTVAEKTAVLKSEQEGLKRDIKWLIRGQEVMLKKQEELLEKQETLIRKGD